MYLGVELIFEECENKLHSFKHIRFRLAYFQNKKNIKSKKLSVECTWHFQRRFSQSKCLLSNHFLGSGCVRTLKLIHKFILGT